MHLQEVLVNLLDQRIGATVGKYLQYYCPVEEILYKCLLNNQSGKGCRVPTRQSVLKDGRERAGRVSIEST